MNFKTVAKLELNLLNMKCALVERMLMIGDAIDCMLHELSEHSSCFVGQTELILPHQTHRSSKQLLLNVKNGTVFNCKTNGP